MFGTVAMGILLLGRYPPTRGNAMLTHQPKGDGLTLAQPPCCRRVTRTGIANVSASASARSGEATPLHLGFRFQHKFVLFRQMEAWSGEFEGEPVIVLVNRPFREPFLHGLPH